MEFTFPEELATLADEADELGRQWAARSQFPEDAWLVGFDREVAAEMGDRGWIGMTWPTEHGGGGRSPLERFVVFEALLRQGAPMAAMWFADRQMGPTLYEFGTDTQRLRWLPDIIAGRSMWCIGMSEPDAGSDVASLRTTAVRDGAGWVVNGSKIWTSGAAHSHWCYLVARTDPDAPKHAGLSEFVVDMSAPGIHVTPILDMTGNRHFCEVRFDDVRVPGDHLVGALNGSFRQLMRQMEHERGGIDRVVSNAVLFNDVMRSGWVDRSDPIVRQELARIESGYRIGRLLVLREVLRQAPPGFSAATKTFGTEFEQLVAGFCTRVAGPAAMLWGATVGLAGRASRNVCYAPVYTIMGGTTQILRNILAERVLELPR